MKMGENSKICIKHTHLKCQVSACPLLILDLTFLRLDTFFVSCLPPCKTCKRCLNSKKIIRLTVASVSAEKAEQISIQSERNLVRRVYTIPLPYLRHLRILQSFM